MIGQSEHGTVPNASDACRTNHSGTPLDAPQEGKLTAFLEAART